MKIPVEFLLKISVKYLVRCPKCHRNMRPWIEEEVKAVPNANPPIPARLRVRCAAHGCGERFYIVDRRGTAT